MTALEHDVRVGLRALARNPAFTAVVVIALALGLGVSTAVFGTVSMLLLRPLPVANPERLAWVFMGPRHEPQGWAGLSYPDSQSLRQERELFSGVVASALETWVLGDGRTGPARGGERPELSLGEYLNGDAFEQLGVHALLGRTFGPAEDRPGAERVLLLSERAWRRRFGADPSVVGRKVYVGAAPATVLGVMPASFPGVSQLPILVAGIECWVPMAQRTRMSGLPDNWLTDRGRREVRVLGRLQPGITRTQAQTRVDLLAQVASRDFPATHADMRMYVAPEIEGRYGPVYATVKLCCQLAMLVAGLVLVICCANVANLLLARAARRAREMGIRLALGSGRARVVRQLLTESLLLAVLGGGLGLVLAFWFGDLVLALMPPLPYPIKLDLDLDVRTVTWVGGATLLAGLAFGALPAWRASSGHLMTVLKTDLRTEGHRLRRPGLRQALVIAQLAVSIVVVACGGLFLRSLAKVESIDPGYQTETLVSALVNPSIFTEDEVRIRTFFDDLLRALEKRPGVRSVSATLNMPLVNTQGACGPIIREGDAPPPPNQTRPVSYSVISGRYFETMGTQLVAGRDFVEAERKPGQRSDVVIVNQELARRLFGSEQAALGKRFRVGSLEVPAQRIIGVARTGRYNRLLETPQPWIFFPVVLPELHDDLWGMKTVVVRANSRADLPLVTEALREEVEKLDARIPLTELISGRNHLAFSLQLPRLAAGLGTILGLLALVLASMGIYSVMTYTVSQRTREIGIRMALGGQVRDILRLVVGQGLGLIAVGLLVGSIAAALVTRLLGGLLHGVSASDPVTFLVTALVLAAVALLATLIPARRATAVDPMIALRSD